METETIAERLATQGLRWVTAQQRLASQLLEVSDLRKEHDQVEAALLRYERENPSEREEIERRSAKIADLDDRISTAQDEVRVTVEALLGVSFERLEAANL
jgi:uncharacterized coiled-coil DUF342 family protein